MLVAPVHTMLVGAPQPPDPETPRIMAEVPKPPRNGNPGIVPPWLQRAADDHARWLTVKDEPDYEPGGNPFDYGYTVDDVARWYRYDTQPDE